MTVYLGILLDFMIGDPKRIPHPVVLIGKLITFYERIFYHQKGKIWGFLFSAAVLLTVGGFLWLLMKVCSFSNVVYTIVSVLLLCASLAWRSLKKETSVVMTALAKGDLPEARKRVGYVVGRDTDCLYEEEIIKANIETVAENTVDGILAPLFYIFIGYFLGWPVLFAWLYKAVNTMDSMVGYNNEKYGDFGFCGAKIDDLLNFIPARLGSLVMLLAGGLCGGKFCHGWRIFRRDRYAHTSPNSGQSESVIAGLLGLELGGDHYYFGKRTKKPTIGDPLKEPEPSDYRRCCRITDVSVLLFTAIFTVFYLWKLLTYGGVL